MIDSLHLTEHVIDFLVSFDQYCFGHRDLLVQVLHRHFESSDACRDALWIARSVQWYVHLRLIGRHSVQRLLRIRLRYRCDLGLIRALWVLRLLNGAEHSRLTHCTLVTMEDASSRTRADVAWAKMATDFKPPIRNNFGSEGTSRRTIRKSWEVCLKITGTTFRYASKIIVLPCKPRICSMIRYPPPLHYPPFLNDFPIKNLNL